MVGRFGKLECLGFFIGPGDVFWLDRLIFFLLHSLANILKNWVPGFSMFVNLLKETLVEEVKIPVGLEIVYVFVKRRDLALRDILRQKEILYCQFWSNLLINIFLWKILILFWLTYLFLSQFTKWIQQYAVLLLLWLQAPPYPWLLRNLIWFPIFSYWSFLALLKIYF